MPDSNAFIDSNILIYAYSITEPDKRQTARDIIENTLTIMNPYINKRE